MEEFNGFDAMGGMADPDEVKRMEAEQKIMWDKVDHLVHQVFDQNPPYRACGPFDGMVSPVGIVDGFGNSPLEIVII